MLLVATSFAVSIGVDDPLRAVGSASRAAGKAKTTPTLGSQSPETPQARFAPATTVGHLWRNSVTANADQSAETCRTDCTVGKRSVVMLSGVDTTRTGAMVVRDRRGRYAAVSSDFRQVLVFDANGALLESPRPSFGRVVSLFLHATGAVEAYDARAGSLLTLGANYQEAAKTALPHTPSLPLGGGRFLVAQQLATPALVGYPLHVMSKDGSIERSFGGDGGVFHSEDTYKNGRAVCLNPDGSIWSIAWGGRLLERWDTSSGRRIAQVTVKSTWFRESSRPAEEDEVANPIILTIWPDNDLVWILYKVADPKWIPRRTPEKDRVPVGEDPSRRFDWVLEAVRSDTGQVVAMKSFDRILLRRAGSFWVASDAASTKQGKELELWTPVVVKK